MKSRWWNIRNAFNLTDAVSLTDLGAAAGYWTTPPHRLVSGCRAGATEIHGLISNTWRRWILENHIEKLRIAFFQVVDHAKQTYIFCTSSQSKDDGSPRSPTPAVCGEPTEKAKQFIQEAASRLLSFKTTKRAFERGRQFLKTLLGTETVVWMRTDLGWPPLSVFDQAQYRFLTRAPYVCSGNVWWPIGHGTSCPYP